MATTLTRTDIHRPSAIIPADYDFVAMFIPQWSYSYDVMATAVWLEEQDKIERLRAQGAGQGGDKAATTATTDATVSASVGEWSSTKAKFAAAAASASTTTTSAATTPPAAVPTSAATVSKATLPSIASTKAAASAASPSASATATAAPSAAMTYDEPVTFVAGSIFDPAEYEPAAIVGARSVHDETQYLVKWRRHPAAAGATWTWEVARCVC